MDRTNARITAVLIAVCGLGGLLATQVWLPLPWMLGALLVSAVVVMLGRPPLGLPEGYKFPETFRNGFIALIGVMIGTQVTPEILRLATTLPWSLTALLIYVVVIFWGNYQIFTRIGGYDRPTAFFSSAPGGLIDSIVMGETAGADLRRLTVQQFLRIIIVIVSLPFAISLWIGHPVGSAAGLDGVAATAPVGLKGYALIATTALLGYFAGNRLHLPASHLIGPLILSAAATLLTGLDLHLPFWLIALAQVVVGASLGLRFRGVDQGLIRRAIGLALISVSFMMVVAAVTAFGLWHITDIPFDLLLITFAPGGVTEMSLIALSLAAAPALVTVHHVIRIFLTVILMAAMAKRLGFTADPPPRPSRPE